MGERRMGDKSVRIEWQLSSPFDTDMMVTVENKSGAGLIFYCSTMAGEDHRYVIGNVRTFGSLEEKDNASSYNGPEFDDLDDKVQSSFDEYLAECGVNAEICDFVDAMAIDKEQREYVRWLKTAKQFVSE